MPAVIQALETSQRMHRHLTVYLKRHVTSDNLPYVMMITSGRERERCCTKRYMFLYSKIWGKISSFPLKHSPHNQLLIISSIFIYGLLNVYLLLSYPTVCLLQRMTFIFKIFFMDRPYYVAGNSFKNRNLRFMREQAAA